VTVFLLVLSSQKNVAIPSAFETIIWLLVSYLRGSLQITDVQENITVWAEEGYIK
jgi:hypothetical protein